MNVVEATKLLRRGHALINRDFGLRYYIDKFNCFRREGITEETRNYNYSTTNDITFYEDELISDLFELENDVIVRHTDRVSDLNGNIYVVYMFPYQTHNLFQIVDMSSKFINVIASITKDSNEFDIREITLDLNNCPIKLMKVLDD